MPNANNVVKNSTTGTMGVSAAKRSRFEKSEVAFGTIPAAAYASGDTLVFSGIPAKEIIYGRIVTPENHILEFFNGTNFTNALAWSYDSSVSATVLDLHYVITYIRGTGRPHVGVANAPTEASGEYGVLLRVTPTVS